MIVANVKYFDPEMPKLEAFDYGDWIDVRACGILMNGLVQPWLKDKDVEFFEYEPRESFLIDLGFAMQCPDHYEAHVVPRSSTFKNYGLIQTNHQGVIDWSYRGDNDKWFVPVYALRGNRINKYDRIAQFRFVPKMPRLVLKEKTIFDCVDRGGHGSTGVK